MLFWNKLCLDLLSEKFFVLKVSLFNIILTKDERKQLTFSLLNNVNRFMWSMLCLCFRHVLKCLLKCSMSQHITLLKIYIILFIFCDKNCWLDLCFPSSSSLNMDLWLSENIEEKYISFEFRRDVIWSRDISCLVGNRTDCQIDLFLRINLWIYFLE